MSSGRERLVVGPLSEEASVYTDDFYSTQRERSRRSAGVMLPLVKELVQPRSVVDVGCGTGQWLDVWRSLGVEDVVGVDGDWATHQASEVLGERFVPADLTKPISLGRRFDLVMSLEVAEHLSTDYAATFVETLVNLGSIVLFSAAIPLQGGTHHVNEQWPEYWAALFAAHGYRPIDCVRRRVWDDERVAWWYAQNTFLFADGRCIERHPELAYWARRTNAQWLSLFEEATPRAAARRLSLFEEATPRAAARRLSRVHPRKYTEMVAPSSVAGYRASRSRALYCAGCEYGERGWHRQARGLFWESVRLYPLNTHSWTRLLVAWLPLSVRERLKAFRRQWRRLARAFT